MGGNQSQQPQQAPSWYENTWWNNGNGLVQQYQSQYDYKGAWNPPTGSGPYMWNNTTCEVATDQLVQAITSGTTLDVQSMSLLYVDECFSPPPPPPPTPPSTSTDIALYAGAIVLSLAGSTGSLGASKLASLTGLGGGVVLGFVLVDVAKEFSSSSSNNSWWYYLLPQYWEVKLWSSAAEWLVDHLFGASISQQEIIDGLEVMGVLVGAGALYLFTSITVRPFAEPLAIEIFGDFARPLVDTNGGFAAEAAGLLLI